MSSFTLKNGILKFLQSFFATWALMKAARMEPGNILTLVFFLLCFFLFRYINVRLSQADFHPGAAGKRTALILSLIFSALYMAVDYPHYIETLTSRLFRLGILTVVFIGFVTLFYNLLLFLFSYSAHKKSLCRLLLTPEGFLPSSFPARHTGLCGFLLCMLFWMFYFLYQYPGIMTPDSINQLEQVLHVIPYSNHHPWVHTLLISVFYHLGYLLTGNMVTAMSFYTFFQMCVLAFSVSFFLNTLRGFRVKPAVCLTLSLFYALVPYNGVFSVTVWKDIPFAAGVLVFVCCLLRLTFFTKGTDLALFVLSGLSICLMRSNGWYAFLLCLPFLFFYFRRHWKLFYPLLAGIFLTALVIKYPVMNAAHVTQPDLIESLAVPTQQIAAVLCKDRPLREDQRALIENVVDLTYIKELYDPYYADNIKELVRAGNQDYLREHKKEFLKLYLELFLAYPGDYLTAYIHQTYGYWYPDSFYLVAEAEGVSATSLGISHTPLIRGSVVIKLKEISIKLGSMLPLYGTLWSMGVALWVLLFCVGNAFVRHEKWKLVLYLPFLALLLSVLIATPVATEFRYVYFLMFALPFYLLTALCPFQGVKGSADDEA